MATDSVWSEAWLQQVALPKSVSISEPLVELLTKPIPRPQPQSADNWGEPSWDWNKVSKCFWFRAGRCNLRHHIELVSSTIPTESCVGQGLSCPLAAALLLPSPKELGLAQHPQEDTRHTAALSELQADRAGRKIAWLQPRPLSWVPRSPQTPNGRCPV